MNLRFINLGFISKRKIAKLLDKCEKNHGTNEDNSYTVPDDKRVFYLDMGALSVITHLRGKLHIRREGK